MKQLTANCKSGDTEKIGAKIRNGCLDLVPYLAVVGGKEEENHSVALRCRKEGELGEGGMGEMALDSLIEKLAEEVKMRAL